MKENLIPREEYLTQEEYENNPEKYPYAWQCSCGRIVKNAENYSRPALCEKCSE